MRSANERGASSNRSPKSLADAGIADDAPVDHHLLRADARPLDEGEPDAAMSPERMASSTRGSEIAARIAVTL